MQHTNELVRIDDTHKGRGVFAAMAIEPGQMIGEVRGVVIDDPDYDSEYCIELDETQVLEPDSPFAYVNHCCEPNCTFIWMDSDVGTVIFLEAIDPIAVGEELTIDYAWPADSAIPCLCGSDECRGWVVDEDELELLRAEHVI
jgi:SET domain-containing protein